MILWTKIDTERPKCSKTYFRNSFLSHLNWNEVIDLYFYSLSCHINWGELQRCQRFPNPLFYEDPLYCSPSLLFKMCPPIPRGSFNCLLSFAKIMRDHTTSNVLFYLMALWTYWPNYEPWYLSTSSILLCVLHNKESNLLKVWHGWHVFF